MRHVLKFLHTMGAIGLVGAIFCLLVLISALPAPASLAEYAVLRGAMAQIAKWIFVPSLVVTLIAGLLAMALNRGYINVGWAWAKLATGVLMFEGGLVGIAGPIQSEAELSASVLAGHADPATLAATAGAERGTLWLVLAVATLNVVLGIWRPRFASRQG